MRKKCPTLLILEVFIKEKVFEEINFILENSKKLSKNEMSLVETIKGTETINLNEVSQKKSIVN